ncbi:MAG: hypothetical protein GQ533_14535 [Methanosarcinaceae archaeon]|nr:hypothetical protein [Desulfobacterales bacterium]NOR49235.1 hypothetical protein [Methanosarcinaceae archaeon]
MNDIDVKFENINIEQKTALMDILGYYVDEKGIIFDKKTKMQHICPITDESVSIDNASILPGSTIIINTTELSLSEYFTDFFEKILN